MWIRRESPITSICVGELLAILNGWLNEDVDTLDRGKPVLLEG
jgi:hypothetical protein